MAPLTDPVLRSLAGERVFIHEEERLSFGYTAGNFPSTSLKLLFPGLPLLFLRQVHSDRIATDREWHAGIEADGLLLDRRGVVAVVQTADCLPLFFFNEERSRGGVLHVGWRGLLQGIEERLAERLGAEFRDFSFFLGPAIEKNCYEVGEEIAEKFAKKPYAGRVFSRTRPGKHLLDIKSGLRLSLQALGAAESRVGDCGRCTYCSHGMFPSYRRDGATGRRLFNVLTLRGGRGTSQ